MKNYPSHEEVVIFDFETTGLSTDDSRVIEVGAAIVKGDKVCSTFSSLCNPGGRVPHFITSLTGITNDMLKGKPSPEVVMDEFHAYIGNRPLLAHNVSFDSRFLHAEMQRIGKSVGNSLLCTMLLARRLILEAQNHKLGSLKSYINFESSSDHQDHRALDDVNVTVTLWLYLQNLVKKQTGQSVLYFDFLQTLSRMPKNRVPAALEKLSAQAVCDNV